MFMYNCKLLRSYFITGQWVTSRFRDAINLCFNLDLIFQLVNRALMGTAICG